MPGRDGPVGARRKIDASPWRACFANFMINTLRDDYVSIKRNLSKLYIDIIDTNLHTSPPGD
jgi:hypothetical protein